MRTLKLITAVLITIIVFGAAHTCLYSQRRPLLNMPIVK